jgi:nucleoid-associated protein YgaU
MSTRAKIAILVVMGALLMGLIVIEIIHYQAPKSNPSSETLEDLGSEVEEIPASEIIQPEDLSSLEEPISYETPKEKGGEPLEESSQLKDLPSPRKLEGEYYIIKRGDTFEALSEKFYGSKTKWSIIQDANPGVDPRRLQIGQKIFIPKPAEEIIPSEEVLEGKRVYTIRSGDTLEKISKRFYNSPRYANTIYEANKQKILNPHRLKVGLKIILPEIKPLVPPKEQPPPQEDSKTYIVKLNDSLWKIAMKLYKNPSYVEKIWELNRDKLPNIDSFLYPGMILRLPE